MNGIFTLGWSDVVKGIITALISAIIVTLYSIVISEKFDLFTADWTTIGHNILNISVITLVSYLFKNFISDNNGNVAGVSKLG